MCAKQAFQPCGARGFGGEGGAADVFGGDGTLLLVAEVEELCLIGEVE